MVKKSDRKSDRRHQQGLESRRRILEAAFELAAERGYDGMTLSQVTKHAGLPAPSVYWQFENKDELLAEVIEHYYREWKAGHTEWMSVTSDEPVDDQVRVLMLNLAQGLVEQPAFQRLGLLLTLERRVVELQARARFRAVRKEFRELQADWWLRVLPARDGVDMHGVARELADIVINLSDGLFVASQIDDDIDMARRVELFTLGLQAIVREMLSAPSAGAPRKATKPTAKPRRARAVTS